jgi:UDP-N-acetylmuramyl pentapeptide phosphotransferase/UDP-N-acetylglucosamine-1-phosphate transferase
MLTLGLAVASLGVSAGGVWYSIRLAHRVGVVDVPNERSSHAVPTPRMGGVPMVAAAMLVFGFWAFLSPGNIRHIDMVWMVSLFALVMAGLGLWDDLSGLSPLFRLTAQIACTTILLLMCARQFPFFPLEGYRIPAVLWVPFGALWVVWMLNLYNFMDGIDGLAGGEAALASSFFFLVFTHYGEPGWAAINLFVATAALGFLVFNWPPARVFMGDAGSVFLGSFFGMQSVAAALTTPVPFLVLILPFSNFILDTTVTLIQRMWRREKWYLSHRNHYYQRMTNLGMSHLKVTSLELFSVVVSCLGAVLYLRLERNGRIAVISTVLIGFVAAGIRILKKDPMSSDTVHITERR